MRPAIIVHGGVGPTGAADVGERQEALRRAAARGWEAIGFGGSALDAAVEAVVVMENDPHLNAGLGSVLTSAGTVEMDASVMAGAGLEAGAVAAVQGVANPVLLARAVLERSPHVLVAGPEARRCAEEWGIAVCSPERLITDEQRRRWRQRSAGGGGNTVGAVVVDGSGHVAAATSTGGIFYKRPGRVGDSAVIGAGTYADDRGGAASATGMGEAIIRAVLAKAAIDGMRDGIEPRHAAEKAVAELSRRVGGGVGLIAVDPFGRVGFAVNDGRMPVALMTWGMTAPELRVADSGTLR